MIAGALRTFTVLARQAYHAGQLLLGGPQHPFAMGELPLDVPELLAAVVAEQGLTNTLLQDIRNLMQHNTSAESPLLPRGAADGPAVSNPPDAAGPLTPLPGEEHKQALTYAQAEEWSAVRGGAR